LLDGGVSVPLALRRISRPMNESNADSRKIKKRIRNEVSTVRDAGSQHRRESEHGEEQCVAMVVALYTGAPAYEYQEMYRGQQRGEQHRIRGIRDDGREKKKIVEGKNAMYASTSQVAVLCRYLWRLGRATGECLCKHRQRASTQSEQVPASGADQKCLRK